MTTRAAVLSIGDELTLGQIAECNARWIAHELLRVGVIVSEHRTVADDRSAIAAAITALANQVALVIVTGGLGPTEDDLTREGVADALGGARQVEGQLAECPQARTQIEQRFATRGIAMPLSNLRQAQCPVGATLLKNLHGTAPGIAAQIDRAHLFCLPGPPHEMQLMFTTHVLPLALSLVQDAGGAAVGVCAVHSCGLSESLAAQRIHALMVRTANPLAGTTASCHVVTARIRATGNAAIDGSLQRAACEVERAWGVYAFGRDEMTLAEALGEVLRARGECVAVAESCTGGGIGQSMTSAPGSSEWFDGGWISYRDDFKCEFLGVDEKLLQACGAVSEQVACAMALGAAQRANTRWGVSATGIAGPTGGTHDKPIGTVWIAVADRAPGVDGISTRAREFRFSGNRASIRQSTCTTAVQLVRLAALGHAELRLSSELTSSGTRIQ